MSATDPRSSLRLLTEVDFSQGGNSEDFRLTGFSHPEDTHIWGLSPGSSISFPPFENVTCLFLLFEIMPFVPYEGYDGLDLWILVDSEIKQVIKFANRVVVSIRLESKEQIRSGFTLNLLCRDAPHPKDHVEGEARPLAFRLGKLFIYAGIGNARLESRLANVISGSCFDEILPCVAKQTGMEAKKLALLFENLGGFCDFGLFQRRLGVEPLRLFRFAAIDIPDLARGILAEFQGATESFDLHYREDLQEYCITENKFRITSHTHVRAGDLDEKVIIERERQRLLYLTREFMDDVRDGGKIFLLRRPAVVDVQHIQTLWVTLNMHTANQLLLVTQTPDWSPDLRSGALGIFEGEVSGEIGQTEPCDESWLKLLGNAYFYSDLPYRGNQ
jgi:hypothetical protein